MGTEHEAEILRQAAVFVRNGRTDEALPRLLAVVRANPQSEQAWLLLSRVVAGENQQRECLLRVVKINPANSEAVARLAALRRAGAASARLAPDDARPADLAPQAGPGAAPAAPRPKKTAPFTTVSEADLHPRTGAQAAGSIPPPIPPSPPPEPTDWLKRLDPSYASKAAPAMAPLSVPAEEPRPPLPVRLNRLWKSRLPRPVEKAVKRLFIVSAAVCALAVILALVSLLSQLTVRSVAVLPTATPSPYPTFPPEWTPTPGGSVSAAGQASPFPTATHAPTQLPTPNSTQRAAMDTIQQQVAEVRGLAIQSEAPRYLISKYRLELAARGLLITPDYQARLQNTARAFAALGLIEPAYDLLKYALNSQVDNLGGLYVPWTKQIVVVGDKFSGLEHYIFAHEYSHALVDQQFGISRLGLYPECEGDAQRCRAIRAFVEGDATLATNLWWQQFASPQDHADLQNYQPPQQALPEQSPPPFALRDGDLAYKAGYAFVEFLFQRGQWAEVNRVYANLPQSTEQILHPDKYLAGEAPVAVSAHPLTDTLGGDWQLIDNNSLGEWTTYLVLGYGADAAARLPEDEAAKAAAGWGGDHYQVFYSESLSATVLAAQWVWDTADDLKEFQTAIQFHLNDRFRGAKIQERTDGDCWEENHQATCLFVKDQAALWVLAPDQAILNAVLAAYPDYR